MQVNAGDGMVEKMVEEEMVAIVAGWLIWVVVVTASAVVVLREG